MKKARSEKHEFEETRAIMKYSFRQHLVTGRRRQYGGGVVHIRGRTRDATSGKETRRERWTGRVTFSSGYTSWKRYARSCFIHATHTLASRIGNRESTTRTRSTTTRQNRAFGILSKFQRPCNLSSKFCQLREKRNALLLL